MIYCFLGDGFEELEAIAPIDVLKRAGFDVVTVGVTGKTVSGSHGIPVVADITADELTLVEGLEAVILPGGMPGTLNLEKSPAVQSAIDFADECGAFICAICAAPQILGHKRLLDGKEAIAFPGFEDELYGAIISDKHVVRDGKFITAKGAGVAVEFGLEIIAALKSRELADETRSTIQSL